MAKLRTISGSMFEAVDVSSLPVSSTSYAGKGLSPTSTIPGTTTSSTSTTSTVPPSGQLVANPGFEAGLGGWGTGDSRTTLVRSCAVAHSGTCAAEIGRRLSTGEAVLDDSPNTVASSTRGAVYTGSAWVKAPAGRSVTLRIREFRGSRLVRARTAAVTGSGSWQQVVVTGAAADGGTSVSLDVLVSLPTSLRAQIDDVSLRRL